MPMFTEISRLLISLVLIGVAVFLFYCGLTSPEAAAQVGMTDAASFIIGANLTYWFKAEPVRPKR